MGIISIAHKGFSKTKIMLKAKLSYTQSNECITASLQHLLLEGVIKAIKVTYKSTPNG
jgi:hypothetical protein